MGHPFRPVSRAISTTTITSPETGADADATYLVGSANVALPNAIVVGDIPNGQLGGTWDAITVDASHSGSTHAATQAAAETTAASALTTHAAAADPHTGYLKESDFALPDFLVGTATGLTAAEIVVGTSPGGELGGTWASPTVDSTHSGSTHAATAASAVTTSAAAISVAASDAAAALAATELVDLADWNATSVPETGQLVKFVVDPESEDGIGYFEASTEPFVTDHGGLSGLGDEDHEAYALAPHAHLAESIVDNRFFRSATWEGPSAAANRVILIAPFDCKIRKIYAWRVAGTSATMNVRVNGTTSVQALSPAADTIASSALVDIAVAEGEYVEARITIISGTATYIYVQADFERVGG